MELALEKELLQRAAAHAIEYVSTRSERPVWPSAKAIQDLDRFEEPLPEGGTCSVETLDLLHRYGSPGTVCQADGRYFGFVNGGALPAALAARWLADVWDQNAALEVMSPVAARLEEVCERWITDLFHLPSDTALGLVAGTSTSLICALAAARDETHRKLGWDTRERGLFGAPAIRVIIGAGAHGSVHKALAVLGFGRQSFEVVPADEQGRMRADLLPKLDSSCIVIVQAGNVNTGSFDPFSLIVDRAQEADVWVHVDGAFGLWASASENLRTLCSGVERADSWSTDAHKTLNVPYDCGLVLCRNRETLGRALSTAGSYLSSAGRRDRMFHTLDMSRRARAVDLWAALRSLGREGVARLVDHLHARAEQMARLLEASGFQILNEIVFNQCLIACETPSETEHVLSLVQASGKCWCSGSRWRGEPAIRFSVCGWNTTAVDIERAADAFRHALTDARSARSTLTG